MKSTFSPLAQFFDYSFSTYCAAWLQFDVSTPRVALQQAQINQAATFLSHYIDLLQSVASFHRNWRLNSSGDFGGLKGARWPHQRAWFSLQFWDLAGQVLWYPAARHYRRRYANVVQITDSKQDTNAFFLTTGNALGIWIFGCRCILESSGSQNSGCT